MADAARGPVLRPMTVADLIDEIFRVYRANFALLFGVSAIVWLPASIVFIVLNVIFFGGGPLERLSVPELATGGLALGAAGIVALLALPVLFGALTAAVSARWLGRPISVDGAIRRGLACFWRIVAGYLLEFLALLAIALVPILGLLAMASAGAGVLAAVLAFLVVIGVVVAVAWLTATWAFLGQAIIVEDTPVLRSFGRSRALVSGSRWRVIGINLLLGLIQGVLFTVPSSFAALVLQPVPAPAGPAASQLVSTLAQIAFYPVQLGTLTLLYYDLRVRREAFDLTLAAERLPSA